MLKLRLETEISSPQDKSQVEALAQALELAAQHLRCGTRWVDHATIEVPGGQLAYMVERVA